MLEDNANSMSEGTPIDVWTQVEQGSYQDPGYVGDGELESNTGLITQANYLWEFVPDNPAYPSIVQGPGELINRQSGLCLDVYQANTGDGASLDQWPCNGGSNQQWGAYKDPWANQYQIDSALDGYGGSLGVGNGSTCTTSGDGDSVYVRTTNTGTGNSCDWWTIQQASYDFATYPLPVQDAITGGPNTDNRGYECLTSDNVRTRYPDVKTEFWPVIANASDSGVTPDYSADLPATGNSVHGGMFSYTQYTHPGTLTGQVMLYCDPTSTTP
jgi:Ricin-type beta-trefoil lectin domain-like